MKAIWRHIDENTNVLNVPGGLLVALYSSNGPCMAFVPGAELVCKGTEYQMVTCERAALDRSAQKSQAPAIVKRCP